MKPEEYEALEEGDVIENKYNHTRKVVLTKRYASEPITQIAKLALKGQYAHWDVILKKVKDEPTS
jgi:hypothetical protein